MGKTHWKKLHNPDYLGAYALDPDKDLVATIREVKKELVSGADGKKEECSVMHFREPDIKPMVLNVTNSKTIEKLLKSPYLEDWAGQQILIYIAQVKAFGEVVDALRIRNKRPVAVLPDLVPGNKKWDNAAEKLRAGETTIGQIKQYFKLAPEHETLLLKESVSQGSGETTCQEQDT